MECDSKSNTLDATTTTTKGVIMENEQGMIVYTYCTECGRRVDCCECNDHFEQDEEDV